MHQIPHPRRRVPLAALIAAALAASALTACSSAADSTSERRPLVGSAPSWSADLSANATDTVPTGNTAATVVLNEHADPSEVDRTIAWLSSEGLTVTDRRASIAALGVSGSYAALASAFDTSFAETRVAGRAAIAPVRDLSIPADLTAVDTVAGLVSTDAMKPSAQAAPAVSDDCAAYWGEKLSSTWPASVDVTYKSNALCGYGPQQLRAIHELPSDATGKGATVAIVGVFDDARVQANTDTYFMSRGLSAFANGQYVHNSPAAPDNSRCGGPAAWTVEQHLDVQAVRAVAPDANIVYWGANDCEASTLYLRVLDAVEASPRPDVVSLSFGGPEELDTDADRTLLNRVLVEAGARGVSVFASTGNEGDYTLAGDHAGEADVASPASSPYITAVGGASIGLGRDDSVAVSSGWEVQTRFAQNGGIIPPGFIYGAGGGESKFYDRPTWQREKLAVAGTKRLLPDVASLADPNTGFTVAIPNQAGTGVTYEAHGGTSLATPMVASVVAIAKARTGVKVGLATPFLYDLMGDDSAIRDITPASAGTWYRRSPKTGQLWLETLYLWDTKPQSLQSGAGWDPVTGLGIPRGSAFLDEFGAQR